MNPLTIHDIEELDRRIDAAVPSQHLLTLNRDVALIHLLRYHESYTTAFRELLSSYFTL